MTRLTKMVDIVIDDYEVEIEIDADDLENFDSDVLWEALNNGTSDGEIAEKVVEADGVMEEIFSSMSDDQKRAAKEAWAEDVNADDVIVTFDRLTTPDVARVREHVLATMDTDHRKAAVVDWLGESVEGGSLHTFLREQVGGTPFSAESLRHDMDPLYALVSNDLNEVQRRSLRNHIDALVPDTGKLARLVPLAQSVTLDEFVQAAMARPESLSGLLAAFGRQYGMAYVASRALEVALQNAPESRQS